MLGQYFAKKLDTDVVHIVEVGNVDTKLVSKTVHYTSLDFNVIVSANGTDILVMLIFHATTNMFSIQELKSALVEEIANAFCSHKLNQDVTQHIRYMQWEI